MKKLWLLLFIVCHCAANAQTLLHFNYLSIKDGLPEGAINAMLKDSEGYFWMGTENGLVRFDGYAFKTYNLPGAVGISKVVNRIFEDKKHNLWIGTRDGFYVYNRSADVIENKSILISKNGKGNYHVNHFLEDSRGNIWIFFYDQATLTTEWLALYNAGDESVSIFGIEEKGSRHIDAIQYTNPFIDKHDRLWLETTNSLLEYNPARKTFAKHSFDTTGKQILWFRNHDTAGHTYAWFSIKNKPSGNSSSISRYNVITRKTETFLKPASGSASLFDDRYVRSCFSDSKRRTWFGTAAGLTLFDSVEKKFIDFNIREKTEAEQGNAVLNISEDADGNFWCRLEDGLAYFNTNTSMYTAVYRTGSNTSAGGIVSSVRRISLDSYGLPWFGVGGQGLQWIDKNRSAFTLYNNRPDGARLFTGGAVRAFAETADGNFWIGSAHGLYYWQPNTDLFTYIHFEKNVTDADVNTVMLAQDGKVWFSAYGKTKRISDLYCYNPKTKQLKNYRPQPGNPLSLPESAISGIVQDSAGIIWISTYGRGVAKFNQDNETFTSYPYIRNKQNIVPPHTSLDDKDVLTMYADRDGTLWLGTTEGSLNKLSTRTGFFTSYLDRKKGFFGVTSLCDDGDHTLWAGTQQSGLFSIDKKTDEVKNITEADGLLWDGCWGVQKDNHNNLWIASPRGFSIVNTISGKIYYLTSANGLPADPYIFHGGLLHKTKSGRFLFSCTEGFVSFNPDDFSKDTVVPVVHIQTVGFVKPHERTRKQTDSLIVRWNKDEIRLSYNENRITFTYVGLLYQNASSVRYAYRLDGYDESWLEAGKDRTATYTNLSPGSYTFHVKAANGDGVWSRKEDAITILIATPWWQSWWFYLLVAIAAFTIIYLIYRYQLAQALQVERVRNRIASDLHDEIGSTLSAIALFSEMAHRQSETAVASPQLLKRINETSQKVTQTMRDIVWSISTKNDSFEKIITHMHEHAAELLNLKDYELHFTVDEKLHNIHLSMEKRQNLYLIYKEALNNIIKYAEGKNVWIHIRRGKAYLLLSVKDDGKGFNPNRNNEGNGLANIKKRASVTGGSAVIRSVEGGGCEVLVEIPV